MSTIKVRRLDENNDPVFGGGMNDYITDADAVAQIIRTRLQLYRGEWWEDLNIGIPMWQSILGQMGPSKTVADRILSKCIASTPYVVRVVSFISTLENRVYSCQAVVETEFGTVYVNNLGG